MNSKYSLSTVIGLVLTMYAFHCDASAVNLALTGTATQSTTFCCDHGVDGGASKAIDGTIDGDFQHGSVSHTAGDQNAFWRVDLGNAFEIGKVTIWNRTDAAGERLTNFRVSILDPSLTPVSSQDFFVGGGSFATSLDVIFSSNTIGRLVQIQLLGNHLEPFLQLAEVQVFQAVPLPGSLLALGSGIGVLAMRRRKRGISN